jgi:hypothetical protein
LARQPPDPHEDKAAMRVMMKARARIKAAALPETSPAAAWAIPSINL